MSKAQLKPQGKLRAVPKKTTFSDREYVALAPEESDIAVLKEGGRYLPIDVIERDLDRWPWSTERFTYQIYNDKFGKPCIAASLDLVIPWKDDGFATRERRLTGGCNFVISSYAPNGHFVATAKSECVKNAASDLGKKFGRGLNEEVAPIQSDAPAPEKLKSKMKPDAALLAQYKTAKEKGDTTAMSIFENVYEIKEQENGN